MESKQRISRFVHTILFLVISFSAGYGQQNAQFISEIKDYRKVKNKDFKRKRTSPLTASDRTKFKGLDYYTPDLTYRLAAKFIRTENPVFLKINTSKNIPQDYIKYGELHFTLHGQVFRLEVYQSPQLSTMAGYEDYLFLPFTDSTNGAETYEGGRYIDFRIPNSEDVILDFNKSYNPLCNYNAMFTCPIPPEPNRLAIAIPAGEKKYKGKH